MSHEALESFQPCTRFFPMTNQVTVLTEDVPYRSREFGPHFAVLYAPYEMRPVGVHVFNARALIKECAHEALTPGQLAYALMRALYRRGLRIVYRYFR
jgi:hypothetical protein